MKLSVCALTALLLGAQAPAVLAQPAPAPATNPKPAALSWRAIPLQNVSPRFLAYWLDPVGNPRPPELATHARATTARATTARATTAQKSEPAAEVTALLPPGDDVAAIVAADAQKTLLVLGTPAGIARVQQWVDGLDQPMRFIEVEAQWIKITTNAATQLGFSLDEPAKLQTQSVSRDARKKLDQLLAQNKAEVLAESYFVAANNFEERRTMTASAPLRNWGASEKDGLKISLNAATTLAVTPSINGDDTLSLRVETARQLLLMAPDQERDAGAVMRQFAQPRPVAETPFPMIVDSGTAQIFTLTILNGDTSALTGFPADWFVAPNQVAAQNGEAPSNLVLLLTARVVPLADN